MVIVAPLNDRVKDPPPQQILSNRVNGHKFKSEREGGDIYINVALTIYSWFVFQQFDIDNIRFDIIITFRYFRRTLHAARLICF